MNNSNKKIAYNTIAIYIKLFINIILGLLGTRIILNGLGHEDFGIYSLVGGTIATLAFFQGSMANASMRFMAYALGQKDGSLNRVFGTTITIHFIFAIGFVLLLEIARIPVFDYLLNIPANKIEATNIVYHCFVITSFFSFISIPYDSIIIAHEDFISLSIIDIIGIILTFLLALIIYYSDGNLLIKYAIGIASIQILLRITKQIYSSKNYPICTLRGIVYDKKISSHILSYTGWNILGSIAAISVTSLKGIILNKYFGLRYNASDGVTAQVSSKLNLFSSSISQALTPRMIKNEGAGDRNQMLSLMLFSTKITAILYACIAIPAWFYIPQVLQLWLVNVPEGAVILIRIVIINAFIGKLSFEITNAIRAVGKIKAFQITETLVIISSIPIAIVLFSCGYEFYYIYLTALFTTIICFGVRIYYGVKVCNLNAPNYIRSCIKSVITPIIITCFIIDLFFNLSTENIVSIITYSCLSLFILITSFFFIGLEKDEKAKILSFIKEKLNKQ